MKLKNKINPKKNVEFFILIVRLHKSFQTMKLSLVKLRKKKVRHFITSTTLKNDFN